MAALLGAAWGARGSDTVETAAAPPTPSIDQRVSLEVEYPDPLAKTKDEKEKCLAGCSLKKHDIAPFTDEQYHAAIKAYGKAGVDETTPALDKLLFYGRRTIALIDQHGTGTLPEDHVAFLKRELARSRAIVSVRFINADGKVRVNLAPVTVPIGIKQHLKPTALDGTQPMEINGTVMRTGLYHLWSRY